MNPYFSLSDKVYDLTLQYPELISFLVANGFENIGNDMMRKTVGRSISIETALKSRHFDISGFEQKMIEVIEQKNQPLATGLGDAHIKHAPGELRVAGVLPCPIRIQLLEKLESWLEAGTEKVSYELQAASMGLDWLREEILESEDASGLANLYLSAGFSLFFDRKVMGRYLDNGVFSDLTGAECLNPVFDNERIDLKDPRGQYTIIGVVPAVFMVNTELLGSRPFPETWADLLEPEFENTIALPMKDLDLFNAVLLGIYYKYGEKGVADLGRNMLTSMHPAQMVKSAPKKGGESGPVVTVMPYFFTWMAKEEGPMRPVWPKDGAIVSPILLMTRAEAGERLRPLVDFLFSKEMGNVLSANGKFPSTHPGVDNGLAPDQTFLWPGWEFIYSHDIGSLLKETERIFNEGAGGSV